MNDQLFKLVKESKSNNHSLEKVIEMFEPKIKKVLLLTSKNNREDLEQELRCKLVICIRQYEAESIPGFFELSTNEEV
ncbi:MULTISPECIES: helix-turn-helix domain-containing protein [Bacillus]|uniref:helix-turn-helix domain-containing protein n=1 Tax=Bacillus TaxID=1386 RepID=UPI00030C15AF|nr:MULTISPECIES: helix-turn-helix domain-containing protein [Bacillus]